MGKIFPGSVHRARRGSGKVRGMDVTPSEQRAIGDGRAGTCPMCGRVIRVRVPRAKFLPGDGTVRLLFSHKGPGGKRCEGSGEPALEWGW